MGARQRKGCAGGVRRGGRPRDLLHLGATGKLSTSVAVRFRTRSTMRSHQLAISALRAPLGTPGRARPTRTVPTQLVAGAHPRRPASVQSRHGHFPFCQFLRNWRAEICLRLCFEARIEALPRLPQRASPPCRQPFFCGQHVLRRHPHLCSPRLHLRMLGFRHRGASIQNNSTKSPKKY